MRGGGKLGGADNGGASAADRAAGIAMAPAVRLEAAAADAKPTQHRREAEYDAKGGVAMARAAARGSAAMAVVQSRLVQNRIAAKNSYSHLVHEEV